MPVAHIKENYSLATQLSDESGLESRERLSDPACCLAAMSSATMVTSSVFARSGVDGTASERDMLCTRLRSTDGCPHHTLTSVSAAVGTQAPGCTRRAKTCAQNPTEKSELLAAEGEDGESAFHDGKTGVPSANTRPAVPWPSAPDR